ncbi:MAG: homocysteine S-methyltransferase family protein [Gammaproteobacteria bacterium]
MKNRRSALPQPADRPFLTDSGLETTLIFHEGFELPYFASFVLLDSAAGRERLARYFAEHIRIALDARTGIVLETPTWRASADWGARLGYDAAQLAAVNRAAVAQIVELRAAMQAPATPILVSGNLGPRGDGYRADRRMRVEEARDYHAPQVDTFAGTQADLVSVFTMNYVEEAIGVAQAARAADMPVVVSFTVETDGRLPSGQPLADAIRAADDATGGYPAYYMLNCAHPSHFNHIFDGGDWQARLRGVRANASRRSHAELDEATELDSGDLDDLARGFQALNDHLPALRVVGGCCGTDRRHIEAIRDSLLTAA